MGKYFAKEIDIVFEDVGEKSKFDSWLRHKKFEGKSFEKVIDTIDKFIEDNGFDVTYGNGETDLEKEEEYRDSVRKYLYGDEWE